MSRWSIGVVALLVILGAVNWATAATDFSVDADSFVIMDADTGKVLMSRNPYQLHPPASTLKVCTALIALHTLDLDDTVLVSRHAAAAPPSKIYIKPGHRYSVRDLLYGVLLSSGNDAARALAEKICGTEDRFARYMTKRVREWGAYRTTFRTASGLPAEDQYSTAYDMALLFRRAMANPTIAQIMNTKTYKMSNGRELRNHNRFLFTTPLAVAGKTGYTRASQHTYVGMFEHQGRRLIISVMGSNTRNKWADRRALIEKGFALCNVPIAQLPPLEEKLRWRVYRGGNGINSKSKKKLTKRKYRKRRTKHAMRGKTHRKSAATAAAVVTLSGSKKVRSRTSQAKYRTRSKKRSKNAGARSKITAQIKRASGG